MIFMVHYVLLLRTRLMLQQVEVDVFITGRVGWLCVVVVYCNSRFDRVYYRLVAY